ncbi:MAG: LysR family transcriptional regulator [Rhodobacteraceae bacterium]|nr:LysR family transcriptional regulator [Paracoccaceae bacterium]MCP5340802.1 LysR family transcriptional regulator [Paracoccaceae bacterium]
MRANWDDLRFILAVAEQGSVSGAARSLGVNHATVLRRVAAYEAAAGVALFDKTPSGYAVAGNQRRTIDAAREVERAVLAVGRILQGARAPLTGEVRVTSTDSFCQYVLPPMISRLRSDAPALRIELLSSNAHLDLGRTHADIAIRPAERLPEDLAGESPVDLSFAPFARKCRDNDHWLGLSGPLARSVAGRWLDANVDPARIVARADSFLILREIAAAGDGMAILPAFLGAEDDRLEWVPGVVSGLKARIWVASHADLADVPRFAEMRRALVRMLTDSAARFAPPG